MYKLEIDHVVTDDEESQLGEAYLDAGIVNIEAAGEAAQPGMTRVTATGEPWVILEWLTRYRQPLLDLSAACDELKRAVEI